MRDHGYVSGTDKAMDAFREMIERRTPEVSLHTSSDVKNFVDTLNALKDSSDPNAPDDPACVKPVGDLLIGGHGNRSGTWWIVLYSGQLGANKQPIDYTVYENLGETLSDGLSRSIKIEDTTIGYTGGSPTHNVHMQGCNIGKAEAFVKKFKQALGDNVIVTALIHYQMVYPTTRGSFEYMCYEFWVQAPAVQVGQFWGRGFFRGFDTREELIDAMVNAGHTYVDGTAVPEADWEKLIPQDINWPQPLYMKVPLGGTVGGRKELLVRPGRKKKDRGGLQYMVDVVEERWTWAPLASVIDPKDKVAELQRVLKGDGRFDAHYGSPWYKRMGFETLEEYMAGHSWTFGQENGAPLTIGRRVVYTVRLPILTRGPDPKLIFRFHPESSADAVPVPDPTHPDTLIETNPRFYFRVT